MSAIESEASEPVTRAADERNSASSRNFPEFPNSGEALNAAGAAPEPQVEAPAEVDHLTDRQRAAIEFLVMGKSPGVIAPSLGIDRRTLYNWRQDPEFKQELERRRAQLWTQAAERLRSLVHPSLDVMEQHLADRYDRARFRAASALLRLANLAKAVPPPGDVKPF